MAIMVSVSCDEPGCEEYDEETAGIDDGVNVIETAGWQHTGVEDYCPQHTKEDISEIRAKGK